MVETGASQPPAPAGPKKKKPFYKVMSWQVLFAIAVAIVLGVVNPRAAITMKPLGDGFIRLITMVIALLIFCMVVTGVAGMEDMKKVGRVGGKALVFFLVGSSVALLLGIIAGLIEKPGAGFNVNPALLDTQAISGYAGQAQAQSVSQFFLHIIPNTIVDAFTRGDILQVILVSILFGFALSGPRCKPVVDLLKGLTQAVFGVVNIIMLVAPIGAFGAMAYTVGQYGVQSLKPLADLILTFYVTCIFFLVVLMGLVAWAAGFNVIKFYLYIKEEILLVLATASSEVALPPLMSKLEKLGCSESLVGLVIPSGYAFNTVGSGIYMMLAALFIAQATNTHLTFGQLLTLFAVANLTSKGASGVQGASFVALVGTLIVIPTIPVAGMALLLGIDRFMAMFRGMTNMAANGVATLVMARWDKEIDRATLQKNLVA